MGITPKDASNKFEQGWLEEKQVAINNFAKVGNTLAQKAINNQNKLLENFTDSVNSGKWANGLRKYIGNNKMLNAYRDKVNSIDSISKSSKDRFAESVEKHQFFADNAWFLDFIYYMIPVGEVTVPDDLEPFIVVAMLTSIMNHFTQQIPLDASLDLMYNITNQYAHTHYGFPIKSAI